MGDVISIKPAEPNPPTKRRRRREPGYTKDAVFMLRRHGDSAAEARAIAGLAYAKFLEMTREQVSCYDLEQLLRALSAIQHLLERVKGLDEPEFLLAQREELDRICIGDHYD
jgi:hypothetical protein